MTMAPSVRSLPLPVSGDSFVLEHPESGPLRVYVRTPSTATSDPPLALVHSVNAAGSAAEVKPLYEHYGATRPTYALDLPGFGLSDRADRVYTPKVMTAAVRACVEHVRQRHADAAVDILGLSLSCEYVARLAATWPSAFRSVALVSPTGFNGTTRRDGVPESTRAVPGLHSVLAFAPWGEPLYRLLTRPAVIRYFLERTWGARAIDEELWAYDVLTARQPGASHAPLYFLSGSLFSNDVNRVYDALEMPVWMSHGVRGDFVDYRRAEALRGRANWFFDVFQTGALPYFEVLPVFVAAYDRFLENAGRVGKRASAGAG